MKSVELVLDLQNLTICWEEGESLVGDKKKDEEGAMF